MPSSIARKKTVSFGDVSIYHVENYKLELPAFYKRSKVWYGPADMEQFVREDKMYREQKAIAAAFKAATFITSHSKKEQFQQQTQAIRNLRVAATMQYSSFMARHQHQGMTHKSQRSTRGALVATRLPSRQQYNRCRSRRRRQCIQEPEIGRIQSVFYCG